MGRLFVSLLALIFTFTQVLFVKGVVWGEVYDSPDVDYLVYAVPPISNKKVLPKSKSTKLKLAEKIAIFACPGEYEPASLAIFAKKSLKNIKVNVQGLSPKIEVDVRVVKCWYQAGAGIWDVKHKLLTPELLLYDDNLIEVDRQRGTNLLKEQKAIRDAPYLLPFKVHEGSSKQLWITVHVSEECPAGEYEAKIEIIPENAPRREVKLEIKVLPIRLSSPVLDYSIYYRGKLREGEPLIGSEWKTEEQMEAELRDMKAHGIDNPTIYQPFVQKADGSYDFCLLKQVIEIRDRAGIMGKPLLYLGLVTGAPQKPNELEVLKKKVRALVAFAEKNGVPDVYIYGIDEAKGERLKAERMAFKAVHEAGGKVFVACYKDAVDLVGDLLDLPIYSGVPPSSYVEKVHKFGHKIWNYGNPQCGVEEALTYRRNYGLLLWQKGLDGTCDYAYQHGFNNIWDDFDHPIYRDHVMAYPTIDGVIPTIQWEGFREGVDDVRYLSTLIKIIEKLEVKAKTKADLKTKISKAKSLLENIRTKDLKEIRVDEFQDIRWQIVQEIMQLQHDCGT